TDSAIKAIQYNRNSSGMNRRDMPKNAHAHFSQKFSRSVVSEVLLCLLCVSAVLSCVILMVAILLHLVCAVLFAALCESESTKSAPVPNVDVAIIACSRHMMLCSFYNLPDLSLRLSAVGAVVCMRTSFCTKILKFYVRWSTRVVRVCVVCA